MNVSIKPRQRRFNACHTAAVFKRYDAERIMPDGHIAALIRPRRDNWNVTTFDPLGATARRALLIIGLLQELGAQ